MRTVLLVLLSITLAGCAEMEARRAAYQAAQKQAQDAADDATCRSYGALPGTEPYYSCRVAEADRRTALAIADAQRNAAMSSALIQAGATIAASPPPAPPPLQQPIMPPTVRCTSMPGGMGTVQTVCR